MSEVTAEALAALDEALTEEDDAAVLEAFWTLEDAVTADAQTMRQFDRLATAVRYTTSPGSDAFECSGSYVESAVELDDTRQALSLGTLEYLSADRPAADVRELVRSTSDADETNRGRRKELESAKDDVGVAAVLAFEGIADVTVPIGTRFAIDVRLSNVGTQVATDVELDVTDAFGSHIEPEVVESLHADVSTVPTVSFSPDRAGSAIVTVTASANGTGDDVSFGVEVLDARGFIARAKRRVVSMVDQAESQQSGRGGGPSVAKQLGRAVEKLDSAADAIDRGAPRGSVDGKLRAAANVLRAVDNRLVHSAGTGLDDVTVVELRAEIPAAIETTERAIATE